MTFEHITVLRDEAIDGLAIKENGTYVDCTVGGGGHAVKIADKLSEDGLLIAFDQDQTALKAAKNRLAHVNNKTVFFHGNFRNLYETLLNHELTKVDGILFDLGVSSPQLDVGERGFSYQHDAELDMRMDQTQVLTAKEIVNNWPYEELVRIFFSYGEERFSKQVARTIERKRSIKQIKTTHELIDLIKEAIPAPARRKGGHPARRIFQALRIAVNDELNAFNDALHDAAKLIKIGGRIAVITFHSLEDRICKQAFRKWSTPRDIPRNLPIIPEDHKAPFKEVTRRPIVPSEEEITHNRRARSARLRIVEKVKQWDEKFTYNERWRK